MSGIFDAIGIMVKQDGRSIARAGGFDAVAIKVKSQRIMARKYGSLLVPAAQPAPPMHKAGRMNQTRRALSATTSGCQRAESHDGEAPRCAELAQTSTRLAPAWAKGGDGDT